MRTERFLSKVSLLAEALIVGLVGGLVAVEGKVHPAAPSHPFAFRHAFECAYVLGIFWAALVIFGFWENMRDRIPIRWGMKIGVILPAVSYTVGTLGWYGFGLVGRVTNAFNLASWPLI